MVEYQHARDAQRLDLDPSGSHTNAYIRRAWGEFGDDFTAAQQEGAQEQQEQAQDTNSVIDQIGEETPQRMYWIEGGEKVESKTEEKVQEVVDEIKGIRQVIVNQLLRRLLH